MRINGNIDGNILIIISKQDAYNLVERLLNVKIDTSKALSNMAESALIELGNIVGSSYITALSELTKLSIKISVPSLAFDMAGAIISFPLSLYGYLGDTAFLIDTEFIEGLDGITLHYLLVPDDESLKILLDAIGVNSIERNSPSRDGGI